MEILTDLVLQNKGDQCVLATPLISIVDEIEEYYESRSKKFLCSMAVIYLHGVEVNDRLIFNVFLSIDQSVLIQYPN